MNLRIGIPLIGGAHWHGGITYIEAIIRAFRALPRDEQPKLYLLFDGTQIRDYLSHSYFLSLLDGCVFQGNADVLPEEVIKKCSLITAFEEVADLVDVIFPVNTDCFPGFVYASWVPDLQHRHLPNLFTEKDLLVRETAISYMLAITENVVVSSEAVKADLVRFYPLYRGHIEVLPFYSSFELDVFDFDKDIVASRYELPEQYMICCNQFWEHKNHDTLFRALALSRHPIHLVCTGAQEDYRNRNWFGELKGLIADLRLEKRVTLLGFIPRSDQIQLIRRSLCMVQPSLFEGWSTVMEDARGLGKKMIASNLKVHLEQSLKNAVYFDPKSPLDLAALLDQAYVEQYSSTDVIAEKNAQIEVVRRQIESARKIMDYFKRLQDAYEIKKSTSLGAASIRTEMKQTSRIQLLKKDLIEKEEFYRTRCDILLLKKELEEKNSVIIQYEKALKAYRLAYGYLPVLSPFARFVRRTIEILRPRLGNLNQYQARSLSSKDSARASIVLNHHPKISIVTPSYGQGAFIERTLCSVLDQGYPNLEYFVQDGGSKDDTVTILKRYEERLSGWVSESDEGQSQAINRGFSHTSGDIMGWLNSDDLLLPGALACVVDYFNHHPDVDVVYGNRLLIDEADMEIGRWVMPGHDSNVLTWVDYVPQETMFWRRSIWDRVGGHVDESFRFAMDWDLLVRFRSAGARFAHIPQFMGAFRIHQQQKTSASIKDIGHQEMDRIRERLLGRVPSRKEIHMAVFPYLFRHVLVDMAYRVKTRLERK